MELKPCPSCGGEPYTSGWNHVEGELTQPTAQVRCNCGWSGPERYGKSCAEEAERVWNVRSCPDLRKLVEQVHGNEPAQSANVLNHAIHNGRIEVVRMIEKLLDGGE